MKELHYLLTKQWGARLQLTGNLQHMAETLQGRTETTLQISLDVASTHVDYFNLSK